MVLVSSRTRWYPPPGSGRRIAVSPSLLRIRNLLHELLRHIMYLRQLRGYGGQGALLFWHTLHGSQP